MSVDEFPADRPDIVKDTDRGSLACPHCGRPIEPWEGMEDEIAKGKAEAVCSGCDDGEDRLLRIERRLIVSDVEPSGPDASRPMSAFERELTNKLDEVLRKLDAVEAGRTESNGSIRQLFSPLEQQAESTHRTIGDHVAKFRERDKRDQRVERFVLETQKAAASLQEDTRTLAAAVEKLQSPSNGVPWIYEQVLQIARGLEVPLKYLNFTARNGVKLSDDAVSQLVNHLVTHNERNGVKLSDDALSELVRRLMNHLAPETLGPVLDEFTRMRLDQAVAEQKRQRIDERLPDLLQVVELERNGWLGQPPAGVSESEQRQVLSVLDRLQARIEDWAMRTGVMKFTEVGDLFDMALHEKRAIEVTEDESRFDTVKEVIRSGYRLAHDDSILRRAWVVVWVKPRKASATDVVPPNGSVESSVEKGI